MIILGVLRLKTQTVFSGDSRTWLGGSPLHGIHGVGELHNGLGYALLHGMRSPVDDNQGNEVPWNGLRSNTHHDEGNALRSGLDCDSQRGSPAIRYGNHYSHTSMGRTPEVFRLELELVKELVLE